MDNIDGANPGPCLQLCVSQLVLSGQMTWILHTNNGPLPDQVVGPSRHGVTHFAFSILSWISIKNHVSGWCIHPEQRVAYFAPTAMRHRKSVLPSPPMGIRRTDRTGIFLD